MEHCGTRKSRRWIAAAVATFLLVAGFLLGDIDVATGTWRPFGAVTPWEWPGMAFSLWGVLAIVIGVLFAWAARGSEEAGSAALDDGVRHSHTEASRSSRSGS